MVTFPNSKINIGLRIIRKRADGYHDLETIFYPVAVRDVLEIIPDTTFSFHSTGLPVAGSVEDNLCIKAYKLLKKDFPQLPSVKVHLHKAIPMGGGLGGGSADGAFMLTMLNKKFQLNLPEQQLIEYALQLGSDCPFFIINKPCFATGRGEILTRVQSDLSAYKIVLVNPGIHISTKEAFANLLPAEPVKSLQQIIKQDISTWKEEIVNDFERTVFESYPEMEDIKNTFYLSGALFASMTGTGSTIFGIFDKSAEIKFSFPENYLCITASIFPATT